MKIAELANILEGVVDGENVDVTGLNGIETARAGDLTFALDDEKLSFAEASSASSILTGKSARKSVKPLIRVTDPKLAFVVLYNMFNKPKDRGEFRHPSAIISDKARIGKNVWIGPNVCVEDDVEISDGVVVEANSVIKQASRIGESSHIYPNVTIYSGVAIGKRVILHSGVVAGSDGFGYVKDKSVIHKFPQLGRVIIGDDVEIGANTTIDRGALSDTIIGSGTKIDNQCQIAHNVKLGKNVIMAGCTGVSGSVTIGDNVTIGGSVSFKDNIKIGSNVMIGGGSGVINDIPDGQIIWGYPHATPIGRAKKQIAVVEWMADHFSEIAKVLKASKKFLP